jgi:hypothetical protein
MSAMKAGKHQEWDLIFVKDWKREPTTNERNSDFGLVVNKDFHIVSSLG